MTGMRVVLISRRFWPLVGGAEKTIAELANGLRRRGAEPTVLTAKWAPDWPARAYYYDTPVIRLPNPRGVGWGTFRYMAALSRWLRRNRDQIEVVCVSKLQFDAYAAVGALRGTDIPVVLRAEDAGSAGDCDWQRRSRFGSRLRRRCQRASAIVATNEAIVRELHQAGYARQRIVTIADGVPPGTAGDGGNRLDARLALASVNSDMNVAIDAPVGVYMGRLSEYKGLGRLVKAWRTVVNRWPTARLWLVGDGPHRDRLYRQVADLDLQRSIVMPGSFEDVDGVLKAANVFVHPSDEPGIPRALLEAVAAGIPVVASETADLLRHQGFAGIHAELVSPTDATALSDAVIRVLDRPPARETLQAARRQILQQHSTSRMVEGHLQLFERLIQSKSSSRTAPVRR
jgi:glycosyltransferase involved in cell wall biosynthesis